MALERTLTILKPDCTARHLIGKVIQRLEEAGFRICALKMVKLTKDTAGGFYTVHKDKPFFGKLLDFMTEAPIIPMILEKENAVMDLRELIGATDPQEASPGAIRRDLAQNKQRNLIHASDSPENARIEMDYFFNKLEQIQCL